MSNPFSVSSSLITLYNQGISTLIETLGKDCTLVYPAKVIPCPNCIYDPIGKKSANRYKTGGPTPFPNGSICPMCGGQGNSTEGASEVVTLVTQWAPKNFRSYKIDVDDPYALVRTYGYASLFPKIQKAESIIIDSNQVGYVKYNCKRVKEPILFGMQTSNFVECFWERSG